MFLCAFTDLLFLFSVSASVSVSISVSEPRKVRKGVFAKVVYQLSTKVSHENGSISRFAAV